MSTTTTYVDRNGVTHVNCPTDLVPVEYADQINPTFRDGQGRPLADLDGMALMAATPQVTRCYFCLNPATTTGEILRHDELEDVPVCGLHS